MATPASYLDTLLKDQQARQPAKIDIAYWANRFLFVPFNDRSMTMELMGSLGLPELKAGLILPITRFRQMIVDNTAVQRVPVGYDGRFVAVAPGIEEMKWKDRPPSVVFDAIMRIFNPYAGVDPAQDNGIREVDALRGNEDFDLLSQIQHTCLPEHYRTGRQQLLQLASIAIGSAPKSLATDADVANLSKRVQFEQSTNKLPVLTRDVAKRLFEATEVAFAWCRWHYHSLQSAMENQARTGKDRLSPLDAAVCEWIEMPEPRYQSRLASNPQQVVVQQSAPTVEAKQGVWCVECGNTTPFGPEGQRAKKCGSCFQAFPVEEPVDVTV